MIQCIQQMPQNELLGDDDRPQKAQHLIYIRARRF